MKKNEETKAKYRVPPRTASYANSDAHSGLRTVQSERLNHSTDHAVFGWSIRPQPLAQATKESQELPGNHTDHRRVIVSEPAQAQALDRHVVAADQFDWYLFTNNDLQ